MDRRLEFHQILTDLIGRAYFQPPPSVKIQYPCAVYDLSEVEILYANDKRYYGKPAYTVTIIDRDPDNDYIHEMMDIFQYCRFDRFYTVDNLNHFVFKVYY